MRAYVRAGRVSLGLLSAALLAACASTGVTEQVLTLKPGQTVAETDKDSRECREKVGLQVSARASSLAQADVEMSPVPGAQYAFAAWVPILIQSVGTGAAQGWVEASRANRAQGNVKVAQFRGCMMDKGYKATLVTEAEFKDFQARQTDTEKEAAMRAIYARYHGAAPGTDPAVSAAPAKDPNAKRKPGK